jgi:hypothetical protein
MATTTRGGGKRGNRGGTSAGKYRKEYARIAEFLCARGATDDDLAAAFGVVKQTIYTWKGAHPAFAAAFSAKDTADDAVERALYERAVGYEHEAVKLFNHNGSVIEAPYVERYAPDVQAIRLWLINRRPKQWRDRQETTHEVGDSFTDLVKRAFGGAA